jgi:hypothetical protein
MLFIKIIIVTMLVFAMPVALVYQIAKRVKVKPTLHGNALWILGVASGATPEAQDIRQD